MELEPSLEREVTKRRDRVRTGHQEFIYTERVSGVRTEDLPARIAEDMTKGHLATVLEHDVTVKEGHRTLLFVDVLPGGMIPKEAIRIKPGYDNTMDTAIVLLDGPILNNLGIPSVIPGYEGQYRITFATIPISTPISVNQDASGLVDLMDAHIPDEYPIY